MFLVDYFFKIFCIGAEKGRVVAWKKCKLIGEFKMKEI